MKYTIRMIVTAMALTFVAAAGAESYRSVKVLKTDGTSVFVAGEKDLAAKFTTDDMTFAVGDDVVLSLPISEVKGWLLSQESKVDGVRADVDFTVSFAKGMLTVAGITDESRISIHDMQGMTVAEAVASGSHTFDMAGLSSGVYVISCSGKSIKINIRK